MTVKKQKKAKLFRHEAEVFADCMFDDMREVADLFNHVIKTRKQFPNDDNQWIDYDLDYWCRVEWNVTILREKAQDVIDRMNKILRMGKELDDFMRNLDKWSPLKEFPSESKQ